MRERRADPYPGAPTREGRGHDLHEGIPKGITMGRGRRMSVRHACLDDIGKR